MTRKRPGLTHVTSRTYGDDKSRAPTPFFTSSKLQSLRKFGHLGTGFSCIRSINGALLTFDADCERFRRMEGKAPSLGPFEHTPEDW